MAALESRFGVHLTKIHLGKRALLEGEPGVFERGGRKTPEIDEKQVKEVHARSGEPAVPAYSQKNDINQPGPQVQHVA
ncbi:MAG: hypothetical protein CML66_02345 [Rhodobacteraceae bacterium]|nr:hypothetical protein [Paracoccaceae bacterium]MAY44767.1 hypothetical protein [Paracoccaceae bacterium]